MKESNAPAHRTDGSTAVVTFSQFAALYGVPASTLANHRARNEDFPTPSARQGRALTYRLSDVREFAQRQGWVELEPTRTVPLSLADLPTLPSAVLAAVGACRGGGVGNSTLTGGTLARQLAALAEPWLSLVECSGIHRVLAEAVEADPTALDSAVDETLRTADISRKIDEVIDAVSRDASGRQVASATAPALAAWVLAAAGPVRGFVADPACGLGLLMMAAADQAHAPLSRIVGVDDDPVALRVSALRSLGHGYPAEVIAGDALAPDGPLQTLLGTCDLVVLDSPFGAYPDNFTSHRRTGRGKDLRKERTTFGVPPVTEQAFRWLAAAYDLLRPGGRAVVVAPLRTLDAGGRAASFRVAALRAGAVSAIVSLPNGLRPGSAPELALWVLEKRPEPAPRPVLTCAGGLLTALYGESTAPEVLRPILGSFLRQHATHAETLAGDVSLPEGVDPNAIRLIAPDDQHGDCDLTPWSPLARPVETQASTASTCDAVTPPPHREQANARIEAGLHQLVALQDRLGRLKSLLEEASHRPSDAEPVSLADLLNDGHVLAYERDLPQDPRSTLTLVDADQWRPKALKRRTGSVDTTTSAKDGDVIVAIGRRDGDYNAQATISPELPRGFDLNSRTLFYLRIHEFDLGLNPQALCDAINLLAARAWPGSSRGPLDMLRASGFVTIPMESTRQAGMRAALEASETAQPLLETLTDVSLWT